MAEQTCLSLINFMRQTGVDKVIHYSWLESVYIEKVRYSIGNKQLEIDLVTESPVFLSELNQCLQMLKNQLDIKKDIVYRIRSITTWQSKNLLMAPYLAENVQWVIRKTYGAQRVGEKDFQLRVDGGIIDIIVEINGEINGKLTRVAEKQVEEMVAIIYGCQLSCRITLQSKDSFDEEQYRHDMKEREKEMVADALDASSSEATGKKKTESAKNKKSRPKENPDIVMGKAITTANSSIAAISEEDSQVTIEGEIFSFESRSLKSGKQLTIFDVSDESGSISCKVFENNRNKLHLADCVTRGTRVKLRGTVQFDHFKKELVVMVSDLTRVHAIEHLDEAEMKRVEFHCHTNLSQMDGVSSVEDMIEQASKWGHEAIAITDHGVVQAFPDAASAGKKHGVRVIYGMEGYLVNDEPDDLAAFQNRTLADSFVVFDVETTGLSNAHDRIIEIGAVRIEKGIVIDEFSCFVNPGIDVPSEIVRLTGITPEMVADAAPIDHVLPAFLQFCHDAVLVAHNASFDIGFIRESARKCNRAFDFTVVDTLALSRVLMKDLKKHKLKSVTKALNIEIGQHHRALDDAKATAAVFLNFCTRLQEEGVDDLRKMNRLIHKETDITRLPTYHVILIAKNQKGLRNLYELVSQSHSNYFYKKPRIPKSLLQKHREGLVLGTACQAGELYQAVLNREPRERIESIASFYDFLEVQPTENNYFLVEQGMVKNQAELEEMNCQIIQLGKVINKPVIATGDVHYVRTGDQRYRQVLQTGMGFEDAEGDSSLHFKTTSEMLSAFSYLNPGEARRLVIDEPQRLAAGIEMVEPIPNGTFPPHMDGADEELEVRCRKKASEMYGDPLPKLVEERLERELRSIIDNGYAVMYVISQKLVSQSLEDGYLVGSRGSVGSSFAATMSGITEVNPLPPHYVCPSCKHSRFFTNGEYESGIDLPSAECEMCGEQYKKDGHQIPFEVFLGFEGDKEPDIDLNFAGEYQGKAHQFIEELFGKNHVFRAGTIGTIATKTAYGYVKKYGEEKGLNQSNAEIRRLTEGCTGVKKTTGQHPGGVMIVPSDRDIHEFSPVQYPANDKRSGVITTHFDYHALSGRLLKLDILGHDVPTMIRMLEDFTQTNALDIPLDDPVTMQLFNGPEALNLIDDRLSVETGTIAIPEFGTKFVRQMLKDTHPGTFGELVRISGLSHGTDVWLTNAQELVRKKIAALKEVICTRDDIMNYLILKGMPPKDAFRIMENVRKGKGLSEQDGESMKAHQIPEWYIDSCQKIKYMFPKAHAVAYVMMSFRIAWYKVHYPHAFYAAYFSMKVEDFDAQLIVKGFDVVNNQIKEMESQGNGLTAKEKNELIVLEVVLEMFSRGIDILPVDLYMSEASQFHIEGSRIRPPLSALQGVGVNAAERIAVEREKGYFLSVEDFRKRTGVSKVVIETLSNHGVLDDIPETNQLTLFSLI